MVGLGETVHVVPRLGNLLALDLGTSSTVICDGASVIYDQPTLIAHDKRSGKVIGIGDDARNVVGKVPGYVVTERPVSGGRIPSVSSLDGYLKALLRVLPIRKFGKPKILVAVPSCSSLVERRSMAASLRRVGFSEVELVDSVLASALGIGAGAARLNGSMVVNVGAGATLSGIIAFGEVVVESSAYCGGEALDSSINDALKFRNNVTLDAVVAEELKVALANVSDEPARYVSSLMGWDITHGTPVKVEVEEGVVKDAILDPVKRIVDVVLENLSQCPAELSQDLVEQGLYLCGGTAQLRGLPKVLAKATNIPVHVVAEPRYVQARGTAAFGLAGPKKNPINL